MGPLKMDQKTSVVELQDQIGQAAYQARAVLVALSADDNFYAMKKDDIAGCLSVALEKLDVILKESNKPIHFDLAA